MKGRMLRRLCVAPSNIPIIGAAEALARLGGE
jgi:hypothetical protein